LNCQIESGVYTVAISSRSRVSICATKTF